jgi:hypothetical protein
MTTLNRIARLQMIIAKVELRRDNEDRLDKWFSYGNVLIALRATLSSML